MLRSLVASMLVNALDGSVSWDGVDEPNAPTDARAEQAVFESLRQLGDDRTTILITYRLVPCVPGI